MKQTNRSRRTNCVGLGVTVDKSSREPLYRQVAQQLASAIHTAQLQPGDRLENEGTLAGRLGVSRLTLRHAITELAAQGLVVRRRGIGTTVASPNMRRKIGLSGSFDEFPDDAPGIRVLRVTRGETCPRAAAALGLPSDAPLITLERLRVTGGIPVALLRSWLPSLPATAEHELTRAELGTVLRGCGLVPVVAKQDLGARYPTADERHHLNIGVGETILTMRRVTYAAAGAALEFSYHAYRADSHNFTVTLLAAEPARADG
ncbi:MAG: GntR family transcriptional regulator [Propionibacteriaceae bacterium]|nr:GntR family transcriptional regulator [Propionibacteriaceae bacterium]